MPREFLELLANENVAVKQVHCSVSGGDGEQTHACFIATEYAYADSDGVRCASADEARDAAARRFLKLLRLHGDDDRAIGNIGLRSTSPVSPERTARLHDDPRRRFTRMRSFSDSSECLLSHAGGGDDAPRATQSATSSPRNDILLLFDDSESESESERPLRRSGLLRRILSRLRKQR